MENYYTVLGVKDNATVKEIKHAYRRLAKKMHPDASRHSSQADHDQFTRLVRAYEVLGDPQRRSLFDRSLRVHPKFRQEMRGSAESFDYRKWLIARGDEESRCKLVLFDLRHSREDDAVEEYVSLARGRRDFFFARYFSPEEAQNWGFILAEEMILRGRYYDAAILLLNTISLERRCPIFGPFFTDVLILTRNILFERLVVSSTVTEELILDAWEFALEIGFSCIPGDGSDARLEHLISAAYARLAAKRDPR